MPLAAISDISFYFLKNIFAKYFKMTGFYYSIFLFNQNIYRDAFHIILYIRVDLKAILCV